MIEHLRKLRPLLARIVVLLALAGAGFAVTTFVGPAIAGAASPVAAENPAARDAVTALTGSAPADALALLPADFSDVMGYEPVVAGGLLTNPDGGCSSPVPLPAAFDAPCRAHDLGYDLLRYAELSGGPLGPWARQGIDAQFSERLHGLCASAGCTTMANTAATAVNVNSWRQLYAVPASEPMALYVLGGAGLASLAVAPMRRAVR